MRNIILTLILSLVSASATDVVIGWNTGPKYSDTLQIDVGSGWQKVVATPRISADGLWAEVELPAAAPHAMFRVGRVWGPTATVSYAWDPSPTPTVIEYVLYGRTGPNYEEIVRVPANQTTVTVRLIENRESVIVTARTLELESDPSNEVEAPRPEIPTGLFIKKKTAELVPQFGRSSSVRRNLTERAEAPRD